MESIREYMIRLLSAGIICSVIVKWVPLKGSSGRIIRMLAGIFMTITMFSPLIDLKLIDPDGYFSWIRQDAQLAVAQGQDAARESSAVIIKEQLEAYILDKASLWDLELSVEVTLDDSDPPVPVAVVLRGAASPYARKQMSEWLVRELGIEEENQQWK